MKTHLSHMLWGLRHFLSILIKLFVMSTRQMLKLAVPCAIDSPIFSIDLIYLDSIEICVISHLHRLCLVLWDVLPLSFLLEAESHSRSLSGMQSGLFILILSKSLSYAHSRSDATSPEAPTMCL